MTKISKCLALYVTTAAIYPLQPLSAQATRTWVSGVGDDVNPCSRTAPCKTFAGAISKTAPGGEINCLDPAGFGAVTINKALTIDCHYTEGGALAGGNGIVINAGATDVVFLRGLDIFGVNPPSNGVRFIAGGALHIEDTVIRRFNAANSQGVSFQPGGAARLYMRNVVVAENGSGATGGGILIQPTGAAGSARVFLDNVQALDNANNALLLNTTGNTAAAGISVMVRNSNFAGSTNGINILNPVGTTSAVAMVTESSVFDNSGFGIRADGGAARIRVGNTTITGNGTGVSFVNGGIIFSYGTNRLDFNSTDGAFQAPTIPEK